MQIAVMNPGLALTAWPEQSGIGSVQKFVIDNSGDACGWDLGPNAVHVTLTLRTPIADYNWKKITSVDDENEAFR